MKTKNTVTKLLKNKTMNAEVYALRRRVIALVYAAKGLVPNLPRVEVRITEDGGNTLGVARMGKNVVWITESAITRDDVGLRALVFHELLHAVYATKHDDACPLMHPSSTTKIPAALCDKLFVKHASKKGA
jgi:hypothetical protein